MSPSPPPRNREPLIGRVCRAGPAGGARIAMAGELDIATAAPARVATARAQADSPPVASFIDLIWAHVLHDAAVHARGDGGRMTFAHRPASLRRLLGLLGLERALNIGAPSPPPRSRSRAPKDWARSRLVPARLPL